MKWPFYILIVSLALLVPNRGTDVGKLLPVEVISIAERNDEVLVRTDTGDMGRGKTLRDAFRDLEDTAPGVIYLDTAEYLLLETEITDAPMLTDYLKESTHICAAEEGISIEGVAQYLSVHEPKNHLRTGVDYLQLEIIREEGGRYWLQKK